MPTSTPAEDFLDKLIDDLASDEIWIRIDAISKIAKLDTPEAYATLLKALEDSEPQVRAKAIQTIGRLKRKDAVGRIARHLRDEDKLVRRRAAITLGQMSKEAKPLLLDLLENGSKVEKKYAAIALGAAGGREAYSHLVKELNSKDSEVRGGAVEGLGLLGTRKAVEPVVRLLKDISPDVRRRAAEVLGALDDDRAVAPLIEALKDPDKNVRWRAVYSLGRYSESGSRRAEEAIMDAVEDEDWNVRRMAVLELRHGDKETFSVLIKALRDRSKFVRRYAAYALGRLGVLKAAPMLEEALNDPAPEVRDQAGWALKKMARRYGYRSWEELVKVRGVSD